jgi:signal transduction histidine kinase
VKKDISIFLLPDVISSISETEVRRLRLTVYLCLTSMVVSVVYTVFDLISGVWYALPYYSVIFITPMLSLLLIRRRQFLVGKILVLLGGSIAIFAAAVSDPFETGVFLLFVPLSIVPFALIGFEHKWTSIGIVLVTFLLFLLSSFGGFELPYEDHLPAYYAQLSLGLNYLIAVTISILIVYFLVRLHRRSELSLQEKEKAVSEKNVQLTKLNEELDRFVYSVSHDLRSPLSSILGLTNLSKYATNEQELRGYIDMIQERIKAQDSFIKDIIEYSRNARTEVKSEWVNLPALSYELIESLKFNEGANRIRFEVAIADDFIFKSDKNRWKTVLSNLLGNAIKYHDREKVEPFVKLSARRNLQTIIYSVEDNGTGIDAVHQGRIFDMFYRATDTSAGSGLGLFITKEAVQKLGGSMVLTSQAGVGSTFEITIPLPD